MYSTLSLVTAPFSVLPVRCLLITGQWPVREINHELQCLGYVPGETF